MRAVEPPFELTFMEKTIIVSEHEVSGKRIFHIDFGREKKPLTITVGLNVKSEKFWTSIPQGRQKEAMEIGKLIAVHIRAKRR